MSDTAVQILVAVVGFILVVIAVWMVNRGEK